MAIFGFFGFVMITGYILVAALSGALVRDYTPEDNAGKLQGVRMIFSVLIPMVIGPMIGNAINKAAGVVLENAGADAMTTAYIPAPGIFMAAAIAGLLLFVMIPLLVKCKEKNKAKTVEENEVKNEV
jgi:MFS family permease